VYVPFARVIVTALLPSVKVGVDPTVLPAESVIVTLCGVDDAFSKSIVTVPAEAVSVVCSNIRPPFGSAWSVSFALPAVIAGSAVVFAGVVVAGVVLYAPGVDAGVVPGIELEFELDPQPASASPPARHAADRLRSLAFNAFASDC